MYSMLIFKIPQSFETSGQSELKTFNLEVVHLKQGFHVDLVLFHQMAVESYETSAVSTASHDWLQELVVQVLQVKYCKARDHASFYCIAVMKWQFK